MATSARELALNVIHDIHNGKDFVNVLLPKALKKSGLSRLDRALATELVYGVLRMEGTIDWVLSQFSSRKIDKISPKALDILRLGVYQLLYLDKIPPRAAVDESVQLAKENFHQGIANFVNGILREIDRSRDKIVYPKKEEDLIAYISLKHSHPEWLVKKWIDEIGAKETEKLCAANNVRPQLKLRANLLKITPEELAGTLRRRGVITTPSKLLPEGLVVTEGAGLAELKEFKEGFFFIQDESSMLVSHILNPQEGETVLDVCAAPGGKTTHMAEIMKNKGSIIAADINPLRLNLLKQSCERMGNKIISIIQVDALKPNKVLRKPVDKVLIDAPCSGLGVLARRPDARRKKTLRQIEELANLQGELIESVSYLVKPGGSLVYSVCTISKKETLGVIDAFLNKHPEFKLDDINGYLPLELRTNNKWIQLWPHKHRTDGMFIARLIRLK